MSPSPSPAPPLQPQSLQYHHAVRVFAVATSIVTARHLFANGFHYPLLMLLAHVTIALVLSGLDAGPDSTPDATTIQKQPHTWASRVWQALFAVAVAVGLIFAYHSFLHNRNTTLSVMLLGLDWAAVLGRTGSWLHRGKQRSAEVLLSITTFLLCIVLLLWKENWLVGKGVKFLLVAVTCIAIARHLWRSDLVENPVTLGPVNVDAHVAGLAVCLPLATLLLAATGWYNRRDFRMEGRVTWIVISTIAGALALTNESRMKKLTSLLQEKVPFRTRIDFTFGGPTFPLLVLVIVEIDNWLTQRRPSTTSGVQWLSFGIAYLITIDTAWVASLVVPPSEEVLYIPISPFKPQDEQADQAKSSTLGDPEAMYSPKLACANASSLLRYTSLAWHAALCSLTLLLVFYCAIGAPYIEPGKRSWDLDIVIAWYDEPVDRVVGTVQLALDLPNIAGRKVRTIVYNKGALNETELRDGFPLQSGLAVRRLQNVGREGDTYLAHVLDNEQDWASHTLFIQAEPHETSYLQARLEDYFVEKTGFLSLSHVRNFCASCDACNDHSGWTEEGTVLRDIFSRSNPSGTCQDLSLTYRGQFVVSSHRMKQANHGLLRELRSRLVDDERFGFTLERSWGTLFQCPTISERCPTLLSGWIGNRAAVADCQCLDE